MCQLPSVTSLVDGTSTSKRPNASRVRDLTHTLMVSNMPNIMSLIHTRKSQCMFQLAHHSQIVLYCIWNTIKTQHISQTATLKRRWWEELLKNKWTVFLLWCDTFLAEDAPWGVSLPPTINSKIYTCELLRFHLCITLLEESVIKHI